jgi:hypothetical protein
MSYMHPAALAARRKYWTRPDAYRFAPPGTPEAKMPGWLDPSATRVRLKEAQEEEAREDAERREALARSIERARRDLDELKREIAEKRAAWERADEAARIKCDVAWERFISTFKRYAEQQKAGFKPDQPRVPVGNPDGGQWTSGESGGAAQVAVVDPRDSAGLVISDEGSGGVRAWAKYAETGDQQSRDEAAVAATTVTLHKTLVQVSGAVVRSPDITPQQFGTAVHTQFARTVRAMNLPGIGETGVEQSFDKDGLAKYGADGSIRTDVVLRNDERIIAVYDLKTGNAVIRPPRAAEIRAMTRAGPDVPVIELHSVRGPAPR